MARLRAAHARDQDASSFASILGELVRRIPGAYAAALVDVEGETVDYAGKADPFEAKVTAAHWSLVLREVGATRTLGAPRLLVVRGARRSFIAYVLPDGYSLAILLHPRAGFTSSMRALSWCERALCREAGWPPPTIRGWYPVAVECDRKKRPSKVCWNDAGGAADPHPLEVIGTVVPSGTREIGFRVRVDSGVEVTLVREPGGFWYADEPLTLPNSR
jgi:hypothetical protein